MSLTRLGNKYVRDVDVMGKYMAPWKIIASTLVVVTVVLTVPLWASPLVGIAVWQGYALIFVQTFVSLSIRAVQKAYVLTLITRNML